MSSRRDASLVSGRDDLAGRVTRLDLDVHPDERGVLTAYEFDRLPFTPARAFTVRQVPAGIERGKHGHKSAAHILVCLSGRVEVETTVDGVTERFLLRPDGPGLLIGPGVWALQRYLDASSLLLVFASEPYDPASYTA